jgi:hypothetical protein
VGTRVAARQKHLGDLVSATRPHQCTGRAPESASVVDAMPTQYIAVDADMAGANNGC